MTRATDPIRHLRALAITLVVLGLLTVGPGVPTALATTIAWGTPEAVSTYGEGLVFRQPVTLPADAVRAEILLDYPGAAGPFVGEVPIGADRSAPLSFSVDLAKDPLLPNTRVGARWRVTTADGKVDVGPQVTVTYVDTRFDWRTKTGPIVRIHWYEGSDAFAERALGIGEQAVEKASKLLGVTETEPIDFFVYATQDDFYQALGPGTRENVGGQASAEIRTLFALITPDEIDASWVGTVVPHELTHLVFDTAVENPYHYPPRWLNEGTAVYLSEGYAPSYRSDLEAAARSDRLMPLTAFTGQFPTTRDQFFLAYAESVSAVSYIVDTYGQDALVRLISAYRLGVSDDEAFLAGLGVTVAGVQAGWLASIGASEPARVGPLPAPAGPVPSAWSGGGQTASTPAPGATPGPNGATPGASGATAAPAASATPSPEVGAGTADDSGRTLEIALVGLVFVLAIAVGAWLALRGRSRGAAPPPPPAAAGSPGDGAPPQAPHPDQPPPSPRAR